MGSVQFPVNCKHQLSAKNLVLLSQRITVVFFLNLSHHEATNIIDEMGPHGIFQLFGPQTSARKTNLHHSNDKPVRPKLATNGGAHLRSLESCQDSFKETRWRWRHVCDTCPIDTNAVTIDTNAVTIKPIGSQT